MINARTCSTQVDRGFGFSPARLAPVTPAQHSVRLTGGYAPRFQAVFLAQADSVKRALPRPTRQYPEGA